MAGKSGFARPPPTDVDPSLPLSDRIALPISGHPIAALGTGIMSALLVDPERLLPNAKGDKLPFQPTGASVRSAPLFAVE